MIKKKIIDLFHATSSIEYRSYLLLLNDISPSTSIVGHLSALSTSYFTWQQTYILGS